ncbi:hypothetical protein [Streptomyces noursei]|nr:hypothetical protein [Streptomyces noursei]UWS69998.1 hypothetical protein N1H47_01240 [Streptomyces noursei]
MDDTTVPCSLRLLDAVDSSSKLGPSRCRVQTTPVVGAMRLTS